MNKLEEFKKLASEIYTQEEIERYLDAPHKLHEGKTARWLIDNDRGDEAIQVIQGLLDCTYI